MEWRAPCLRGPQPEKEEPGTKLASGASAPKRTRGEVINFPVTGSERAVEDSPGLRRCLRPCHRPLPAPRPGAFYATRDRQQTVQSTHRLLCRAKMAVRGDSYFLFLIAAGPSLGEPPPVAARFTSTGDMWRHANSSGVSPSARRRRRLQIHSQSAGRQRSLRREHSSCLPRRASHNRGLTTPYPLAVRQAPGRRQRVHSDTLADRPAAFSPPGEPSARRKAGFGLPGACALSALYFICWTAAG